MHGERFLLAILVISLATCRVQANTSAARGRHASNKRKTAPQIKAPSSSQSDDPVLVGAGDIASCDDLAGAQATAKLIDKIPGTVFAVGDLAYPDGVRQAIRQLLRSHLGTLQGTHSPGARKPRISGRRGRVGVRPVFWNGCGRSQDSLLQLQSRCVAYYRFE